MKLLHLVVLSVSLFSMAANAGMTCYKEPANANAQLNTGGFDKKAATEKGYNDNDNPAGALNMCFLQAAFEGPQSVIANQCGCKEAVKEMCKFNWKKGVLKISAKPGADKAWCVPFSFMAG